VSDVLGTGIAGLDHLLHGGLAPNRLYLVEGRPGTGKTTLALQYLLEGRRHGEPTLYVTLSETSDELNAVAASHGWSLEGIELMPLTASEGWKTEEQYTLYHPAEVELGETINEVLQRADRLRPTRLVIDSLAGLKLLARDPLRFRRQILALKEFFTERACTVLLLDDLSGDEPDLQLESLAHGVILLEQRPFDVGRGGRLLRVVKLRGVAATEGFHDFAIRRGGLVVFPQLSKDGAGAAPPVVGRAARDTPIASGIRGLDELLGGGLTWGTATIFIGPAGGGKSTLAAHYVTAARQRAAVFLFDEARRTFVSRCDNLGMDMTARIAAGDVSIAEIEPGDLSAGEFSHRVRDAVEGGARLVTIDSLNGYLNAIPHGATAPLVRMHDLLTFLSARGVATLITVAQHGVLGVAMETPIEISYLSDCVVLLRFFEAFGHVRRAVSIVKKRTGAHETTIRELQFGPDGVHVGGPLAEFQGVLTGVPQYTGPTTPLLRHEH
jgi:circadian clock protein KaiC